MGRVTLFFKGRRTSLVFPQSVGEIDFPLGAIMMAQSALALDLQQEHRFAGDIAAAGGLSAFLSSDAFELGTDLAATGDLAPGLQQDHLLARTMDASGVLSAGLEQSNNLRTVTVGTLAMLVADLFVGHELACDLEATGALDADLDVTVTNDLAVDIAATGALTADLDVTAAAGDPAFRCVAVSYTGNGGTQAITGVGFQPELIIILDAADTTNAQRWITQANDVGQHWKPGGDGFPNFDKTQSLSGVTSFDADGFTLGSNSKMNANGTSYVALCLAAGTGTEAANFEAQLQTRQFTQVTYAHSLDALPIWVWSKRDDQAPGEWISDAGLQTDSNNLGGTIAANSGAVIAVSSDDITIGTDVRWNGGSDTGPLILFGSAESAGKYKTGTYSGTGAANNAITGLGFQPSVVMIRSIDGLGLSILTNGLSPQTAFVIGTGNRDAAFTLDADGFTVNGNDEINRSGETFRYFAWV